MSAENKIELSIVPIRMADLIGYIARRKKLSYNFGSTAYENKSEEEEAILRKSTIFAV